VAEDPLRAVVRGTGIALKELDKYKNVLGYFIKTLLYLSNSIKTLLELP
jgi:hypothetical protein